MPFSTNFFSLPILSYYLTYLHVISLTFPPIISSISTSTFLSFSTCLPNQLIYRLFYYWSSFLPYRHIYFPSLFSLAPPFVTVNPCSSKILFPSLFSTPSFDSLFHSSSFEISSFAFSVPIRALQYPILLLNSLPSLVSPPFPYPICPLIFLELLPLYYCTLLTIVFVLFSFIIKPKFHSSSSKFPLPFLKPITYPHLAFPLVSSLTTS